MQSKLGTQTSIKVCSIARILKFKNFLLLNCHPKLIKPTRLPQGVPLTLHKPCIHSNRVPTYTSKSVASTPSGRLSIVAAAAAAEEQEDLWQYADRDQWYVARFCATDQPDWNPARFVRSTELAPGVREIVLDVEISRERIPLRNAYKHVGQKARIRVNGGEELEVSPIIPPFPESLNKAALYNVRNDIKAEETKKVIEPLTIRAELSLMVRKDDFPDLYKIGDDDLLELGPFSGSGLDLRGPISGVFMVPTIVIFTEGEGIAAAKALIEATPDANGLCFNLRQDVRLYYRARNETEMCFKDLFEQWEAQGVKVATSTRDSFQDMFDDDDTLMYEPSMTAAIILTGSDEEAEAAAVEVCKEAEISIVVKQSEGQVPTQYLVNGKE